MPQEWPVVHWIWVPEGREFNTLLFRIRSTGNIPICRGIIIYPRLVEYTYMQTVIRRMCLAVWWNYDSLSAADQSEERNFRELVFGGRRCWNFAVGDVWLIDVLGKARRGVLYITDYILFVRLF